MRLNANLKSLLGAAIFNAPAPGRFPVHNPATGEVLAYVADQGAEETRAAITAAATAFPAWAATPSKARADILKRWHRLVLDHAEDLGLLVMLEQGRVLTEARGEVTYGASFIEWFAEEARRAYGRTIPAASPDKHVFTLRQPVGVCAAITPWNFPVSMITRKVSPALAAGCSVVIKPSEETPLSALALAALAQKAGLPEGIMAIITTLRAPEVGAVMTGDERVKKLSFTGSTPVGKALYAQCAAQVKKVSLELGGNAPFLIFDDARLEAAVDGVMASKFRNAGQTCVCANRILVQAGIFDAFVEALKGRMKALKVGPGWSEGATTGPLINQKAVAKVDALIVDSRHRGAEVTCFGEAPTGSLFVTPTLITGVSPDMDIFSTEIFGPVIALVRFETEDEAIRLANDTPFGLAAYAFTRDTGLALRVAQALQYGMVGLNDGVFSSEVIPFGGIKESGIGREGGSEGLEEYLNLKMVSLGGVLT